jgi:uncharacterized protein YbaP (TraB family)
MKLLALFFIFTCALSAFSQLGPTEQPKTLLWKIEEKGTKKASYLFGTMHLMETDKFFLPKKVEKSLRKSEIVVLELPGIPNQAETMPLLQLQNGTFFDFFDSLQTDSIVRWANEDLKLNTDLFLSIITPMKPFVLVQMASQIHFMGKTTSYERTLIQLAEENKLEIAGLETILEQLSFFDNLEKSDQREMVMECIRNPKALKDETTMLQQLYLQQDIYELYQKIVTDTGILAKQQHTFLDNRNKSWIPKIQTIIANKSAFIAVGAAHLAGPNGLIQLLQNADYTVTPIPLNFDTNQ